MDSKSSPEIDAAPDFDSRISFSSGRWIAHRDLRISVDDSGFRQGATAVERMRTYNGRVFATRRHLARWSHTTRVLGIDQLPAAEEIESLIETLISRNRELVRAARDVGVTMFATPGSQSGGQATFGMHLNPLDHQRNRVRRELGQPIVVTNVTQPPESCWPRSLKVRSRLHYYLADQQAHDRDPDAVGVLLDVDGSLTETSIANLAMIQNGQVVSPPADRVLEGVTQSIAESIATELGIVWIKRTIRHEELLAAEDVFLMGTDTGVWPVNRVDDQRVVQPGASQPFRHLQDEFEQRSRA